MNEEEYFKSLPQKRMSAGVIIFDEAENILLVKPNYKDFWLLPGGTIEKDESPRAAALREAKEETNLELASVSLVCVDYMSSKNSGFASKDENIQFIFFGGKISAEKISQIKIQTKELDGYKFATPEEALKMVGEKLAKRLGACLEAIKTGVPVYLEGGK